MVARAKKSSPSDKKSTGAANKAKTDEAEVKETVVDAAEDAQIADTTPDASTTPEEIVEERVSDADISPDDPEIPQAVTDEASEKPAPEETSAEPTHETSDQKTEDTTTATIVHPVPVPVEPERSSGFWPLVLGGLIAGGIGFGVAELDLFGGRDASLDVARLTTNIQEQNERIISLEEATPDTGPVDALTQEIAALSETLAGYENRIKALEDRPIAISADTGEADAYAAELARLQASVESQSAEIQSLLENALSVEEATAQAAKVSSAQAALARITSAINAGQSFVEPVGDLKTLDVDVPESLLKAAETGVITLPELQSRFPDAARAALSVARAEAPADEGGGGFGNFLKRQLGARSVAPREGNDPDAILSRAEDAVRNGRLSDALAEITTLPEPALGAMQDWVDDARARDAALTGAETLAQRLTAI